MIDKNGKAIVLATKLGDLPFCSSKLLPLLSVNDLESESLNEAITKLGIGDPNDSTSFSAMTNQFKLQSIVGNNDVTIQNLVQLFKEKKSSAYSKILVHFSQSFASAIKDLNAVSAPTSDPVTGLTSMMAGLGHPSHSSSPRSASTSTTTSESTELANALKAISDNQIQLNKQMNDDKVYLASMIYNMNQNMVSSTSSSSYAKTPSSQPPTFSNSEKKNCLSLKRFYKNKFSRWMKENKLQDSDVFIYLHKIFPSKTDQERAWNIVEKYKNEGIEKVLDGLGQFFRLNELEILELQDKFFSFKIDQNSDFGESFNRLYELQASIQADSFVESQAIVLVKNQFRRCVQRLSSQNAVILRPIFISQKWDELATLDDTLQLLRQVVGKSRNNDTNKETSSKKSESSVSTTATSHPDDMEVSAIGASRSSGKKKKHKKVSKSSKSKPKSSKIIFCPKDSCKAKNIFFAKFCNSCGSPMPKSSSSSVASIDARSGLSAEDEDMKAEFDMIMAGEEGSDEELEVSNGTTKVFTLDRSKHTKGDLPTVQVKFFNDTCTKHSKAYKSLFDTGARLNYIGEETFNLYRKKFGLILFDCKYRHETASGGELGVLGYTILPSIEVTDSFNNKYTLKSAQFRVVSHLSNQVIIGRNIMKSVCPGNGFLMFFDPTRVLLNVNLKNLNFQNKVSVSNVNSVIPKFCDFDEDDELVSHHLEGEDILVSTIEPLSVKMENIGTKAEPIWTSSARSTWFKNKLKSLISRFRNCTSSVYKPFKIDPVRIEMKSEIPSGERFIKLQPHLATIMKKKVDKLANDGILRYTDKPANGCLMLTPKNNGVDQNDAKAWRVVNDLVKVNKYVKPVEYHLPPILDLLNQCQGFSLFAKFDIPDAYHNIPIVPDQPIVARVPGHTQNVEYLKLAQGLAPASGIFCKVLDKFFSSMDELLKYLDDLLLKAKTEADLLSTLTKFFQICEKYDVRISLAKSRFGVNTLEFLSYKIHDGRIGISDAHRRAIESIKGEDIPAESLTGFLGYFQNYISDKDLMHLLRDTEKGWTDEKEKALEKLKNKILSAPMRTLVNFKNELKIFVDAADSGLSTALFQVDDTGENMEVVSLFNKNMTDDTSWINKNIYQRELLALATAVQKYEYMLRGSHKVTLYTDNQALAQSKKSRAFSIRNLFDRLESDFPNVSVEFVKSADNSVADILSRANKVKVDEIDHIAKIPVQLCPVTTRNQVKNKNNNSPDTSTSPNSNKKTTTNAPNPKSKSDPKNLDDLLRRFVIFHEKGGHHSAEKLFGFYKRVYSRFYPGLTLNRLREVLSHCSCPTRKRDLTNFVPRFSSVNRQLFLDFKEIGTGRCPLDSTKKMYRLSIIEPLSGALFSIPHKITTGESVVNSLCLFLQLHGKVLEIRTDNAPAFVAGPLKKFCDGCDIKIKPSSAHNPTGNLSERHHSNLNKIINLANKPSFEEANQLIFDYITSYNCIPATHGFAPYEVLKGQIPVECLPSELDYDLDKRIPQKLTAPEITDIVWENRSKKVVDKLPSNEKSKKFFEGQSVFWHINMPTGGLKIFPAKILDLNQSSALLDVENSNKKRWIALHHLRRAADTDLLSLCENKNKKS